MFDIIINEPLPAGRNIKIYQGQRWRYPSMTDVKFINKDTIVAAHRYGCKVYLISIRMDGYQILDSMTLMHNSAPYQTESFIILNNVIYLISFTNIMFIIDILPSNHLKQRSFIKLSCDKSLSFHGIAARGDFVYVTPSKKTNGREHVVTYNICNGEVSKVACLGDSIRVKGLAFLPNNLIIVIINYKAKTSMIEKGHTFDGAVRLYTLDFALLDSIEVPLTHFDVIVVTGHTFYATGADLEGGYIFKGTVNTSTQKIVSVCGYPVHDFPHGIDIIDTTIVYTSYTTSGIHFISEDALDAKANPVMVHAIS
jgi:hypothetical protein